MAKDQVEIAIETTRAQAEIRRLTEEIEANKRTLVEADQALQRRQINSAQHERYTRNAGQAVALHSEELRRNQEILDRHERSTRMSGRGFLYLSQTIEDAQYGFSSIVNNIPQIVQAFGGSDGLSGAVGLLATAINMNIRQIGEWKRLFRELGISIPTDQLREFSRSVGDLTSTATGGFLRFDFGQIGEIMGQRERAQSEEEANAKAGEKAAESIRNMGDQVSKDRAAALRKTLEETEGGPGAFLALLNTNIQGRDLDKEITLPGGTTTTRRKLREQANARSLADALSGASGAQESIVSQLPEKLRAEYDANLGERDKLNEADQSESTKRLAASKADSQKRAIAGIEASVPAQNLDYARLAREGKVKEYDERTHEYVTRSPLDRLRESMAPMRQVQDEKTGQFFWQRGGIAESLRQSGMAEQDINDFVEDYTLKIADSYNNAVKRYAAEHGVSMAEAENAIFQQMYGAANKKTEREAEQERRQEEGRRRAEARYDGLARKSGDQDQVAEMLFQLQVGRQYGGAGLDQYQAMEFAQAELTRKYQMPRWAGGLGLDVREASTLAARQVATAAPATEEAMKDFVSVFPQTAKGLQQQMQEMVAMQREQLRQGIPLVLRARRSARHR